MTVEANVSRNYTRAALRGYENNVLGRGGYETVSRGSAGFNVNLLGLEGFQLCDS